MKLLITATCLPSYDSFLHERMDRNHLGQCTALIGQSVSDTGRPEQK